jgi:hypothetical protein
MDNSLGPPARESPCTFLQRINEFLPVLSVFLDSCGSNSAFISYKNVGALGIHEILPLVSTFLSNLGTVW